MSEHNCEPDRWPTKLGQSWICPECQRLYVATRSADSVSGVVKRAVDRGLLDGDALGWFSPAIRPQS